MSFVIYNTEGNGQEDNMEGEGEWGRVEERGEERGKLQNPKASGSSTHLSLLHRLKASGLSFFLLLPRELLVTDSASSLTAQL